MGDQYLPKELVPSDKLPEPYIKGENVKIVSVPTPMDNIKVHALDKALEYVTNRTGFVKIEQLIDAAKKIETYLRGDKDEANNNLDNAGDEAEREATPDA